MTNTVDQSTLNNDSPPGSDDASKQNVAYTLADYVDHSPEQAEKFVSGRLTWISHHEFLGQWNVGVRNFHFEANGRLMVAAALKSDAPSHWLNQLATARDRLASAMDYESIHGEGSLLRPDYPVELEIDKPWLEELAATLARPEAWSTMLDWRTFDFIDAARSGLRPGTPPPTSTASEQ